MSTEERDYDDFSIVPERDELVTHRKKKRGNSMSSGGGGNQVAVATGASAGLKFLLAVLVLGMLGSAGGAYYFYGQGQEIQIALDRSSDRIVQLENRLNLVDESAEQSSMGLLERVDFNFSEIDKLWAARNVLRSDIAGINSTLENQAGNLTEIETVVANQASMINQQAANLDQNDQLVATIRNQINNLNSNVAALNNLNINQQLSSITGDLDTLKSSLQLEGSGLENRVNINEQDIESINLYRLSLNQTLNAIQQSLNELEERVARMSPSPTAL
jgi:chromosome segregation ATPase